MKWEGGPPPPQSQRQAVLVVGRPQGPEPARPGIRVSPPGASCVAAT